MLRCCWRPVVQLGRPYIPHRLESRYTPPKPLNPQLIPEPLAQIHAFLAPTNLASENPITYTPKALHKLYLAVKALPPRKNVYPLRVYELNELLVLFGSLSLPAPRPKSRYIHSFASRILAPVPFRTYWPLVLELAEEIRVRPKRKPRTDAHHFWVMRAHLARMRTSPGPHDVGASEATARYRRIRKSPDPEAHIAYLRSMLSLQRGAHLSRTVHFLCKVLESSPTPDHRFSKLLWQIVLGHDTPTAQDQERILAMVWTRLVEHTHPSGPSQAPRHVYDPLSKRHIPKGMTISELCTALATTLFPHFAMPLPEVVSTWAATEAKAAFDPQLALRTRWYNLVVLALQVAPAALAHGGTSGMEVHGRGHSVDEVEQHVVWRTVLALAILERTIPEHPSESVRTAVRRLWRTWRNATELFCPPLVRRVVVGTCFRLAARTRDGPLKDGCVRYCTTQGLWGTPQGETKWDVTQTTNLLVDYVYAALYTNANLSSGTDIWVEIFESLPPGEKWRTRVADALFRAFLPQDVTIVETLYSFCRHRGIPISGDSVLGLGLAHAQQYYPDKALEFFSDARLTAEQEEELLDQTMRTLRRERHTFKDVPLANILAPVMTRLYLDNNRTSKDCTKFSVRYALGVLASSGHPVKATILLRVLNERQPNFFSIHYFLRMMRTLVRHRRTAALSLLPLLQRFAPPARQNARRKLMFRLARTGAHTLADKAYRLGGGKNQPRTTKEILAKTVRFRVNLRSKAPPKLPALGIERVMRRQPQNASVVRYGVSLLARVGRLRAGKRAIVHVRKIGLGDAVIKRLGNTLLNGALHRTKSRNARLVRHILHNRKQLEESVGFVQDRVTVNILVKVLLRWKTFMSGMQIRRLFDHMVRNGYPAPLRWRKAGGVPFGTPVGGAGSNVGALDMANLSPFMSFERHVRPLYRMFIKAFHLQGDAVGARTVIGILHDVEDEVLVRRHARRRARLAGILRKKMNK
ncbi:hypothetical protein R3P38DRAFT_3186580 [Favolaschia claudopus]|uniref:Uncharacterized protein n=1 Tax=Favolaschia claudopus TaxID=2862362 RepID=A0AAW0C302_9AGAR